MGDKTKLPEKRHKRSERRYLKGREKQVKEEEDDEWEGANKENRDVETY